MEIVCLNCLERLNSFEMLLFVLHNLVKDVAWLMKQEPEDEFPTKLVGYFFLAWFILSVALSVTLNKWGISPKKKEHEL